MSFKQDIAKRSAKKFVLGSVIIKGVKHNFTSLLYEKNSAFSDAVYMEVNDTDNVKYTMPTMR